MYLYQRSTTYHLTACPLPYIDDTALAQFCLAILHTTDAYSTSQIVNNVTRQYKGSRTTIPLIITFLSSLTNRIYVIDHQ